MSKTISKITMALVFLLALGALAISYESLKAVAETNGILGWKSYIWPLLLDFALVVFSLAVVRNSLLGERQLWPWSLVILFSVGTLGFNVYHAAPTMAARIVAAVAPVALFLSFETLMSQLKSEVVRTMTVQSLADLRQAIEQDRTQTEALAEEISQLTARKTDLEVDVKRLQKERREAKKTGQGGYPTEFSQTTVDKGLTILVDAIQTEGDISGAEFGRRVGISNRKGLDLKKMLWPRAAMAANGHSPNGNGNGSDNEDLSLPGGER